MIDWAVFKCLSSMHIFMVPSDIKMVRQSAKDLYKFTLDLVIGCVAHGMIYIIMYEKVKSHMCSCINFEIKMLICYWQNILVISGPCSKLASKFQST